eukprot:435830-Prymnesium_polylepis.1
MMHDVDKPTRNLPVLIRNHCWLAFGSLWGLSSFLSWGAAGWSWRVERAVRLTLRFGLSTRSLRLRVAVLDTPHAHAGGAFLFPEIRGEA